MKDHRELLNTAANVLLIVLLFVFIIVGLNKIGVYTLPSWAEKLIGTYTEPAKQQSTGDGQLDTSITFDENSVKGLESTSLTYKNAEKILKNLRPVKNYEQTFIVETSSSLAYTSEEIEVECKNGKYTAAVYNSNGELVKELEEQEKYVVVTNYHDGTPVENKLPLGTFGVYESCGIVHNVDAFLKSGFVLDEASYIFSEHDAYGTVITIIFETKMDELALVEQYSVSLDFGVVLSAISTLGEERIYYMTTDYFKADL